jgi:uncharacterized protein YkwD
MKPNASFFVPTIAAAFLVFCSCSYSPNCFAKDSATVFAAQSADPNRPPTTQDGAHRSAGDHRAAGQRGDRELSEEEKILFDHVNESRVLAGLPALRWDAKLAAAAREHCALLVQHDALSHQFPGEPGLQERLNSAGAEFSVAAENVALAPTPEEIHYEWMHSPPHRANILDPQLNAIGIAAMPGNRGLYAVQDFSHAVEQLSLPEQEEKVRNLISATGVRTADNAEHTQWSDARKSCTMSSGFAGKPAAVVHFETSDVSKLPPQLETSLRSGKYRKAAVGACEAHNSTSGFMQFRFAVLLYEGQ